MKEVRRVIGTTLKVQGYDVDVCRSGEALELARSRRYALVLLDPGTSGAEGCRELRRNSAGSAHIIVVSVQDAIEDKVEALDAGALDYVTKPFSVSELLARIRSVLRRVILPVPGVTTLKLDDIKVNFCTRRVTVAGRFTRLTPKECGLLICLARHLNETITHRELLLEVWGPEHVDDIKYLRVFVSRLERKIEPSPKEPKFLLTEASVGYRLQTPD